MMGPSSRTSSEAGASRWLALIVLCAGMLMIVLDATIVNVALPSIRSQLGFTQSTLAWVVNAYLIAFGGVLPAAGASFGLLAGGFLTQALNWHWIFLVNVPIGIVTAFLALRLLESDRGIGLGKGADVLGAFLVTAALFVGVYTIIRSTDFG